MHTNGHGLWESRPASFLTEKPGIKQEICCGLIRGLPGWHWQRVTVSDTAAEDINPCASPEDNERIIIKTKNTPRAGELAQCVRQFAPRA